MSSANTEISPQKRIALAVLELAKNDAEIGGLMPKPEVREAVSAEGQTLIGGLETIFAAYSERPALGEREYSVEFDPDTKRYRRHYTADFGSIKYADFQSRIKQLAQAWGSHPIHGVAADEKVCIMGFTGIDFATLDYACIYAQAVTIPLQSATAGADLTEIFNTVEPVTIAATIDDLLLCTELAIANGNIRSLVVFDYDARDDRESDLVGQAKAMLADSKVNTALISLDELLDFGDADQWQELPQSSEGGDRMVAIIHSSGSTGTPKGAVISENAIRATFVALPKALPVLLLHIAPLNHLLGRGSLSAALRAGGTAYFTLKPDMSTLFEDVRVVRPCYMVFFPRILELIHQNYQSEVARRVRLGEGDEPKVQATVEQEMSANYLGDRLKSALVAGAPTSEPVKDFIEGCFGIMLINMYGSTESGSGNVAVNGIIQRPPVLEYKLRDVPELGYYSTDKPYPRGEFCFKSAVGITKYYKQETATAGLFDEDGFSLSGDVVEERAPDHIVVIDRVKDVLKLSQGEYVAVGTLGTQFEAGSAIIKQIYIYGNSLRAYLVAVVVPDLKATMAVLGNDYSEAELKNLIRDEMQNVAKSLSLKSFEVPRDFIIENEPFSQENGLLSSVRKRLRPALKRKYGEELEAIYQAQDNSQQEELEELKKPDSGLSVLDRLTRLMEIHLKTEGIDSDKPRNFNELGGDSLAAVGFSLAIDETFGVELPADYLLSPTGNLRAWAAAIEESSKQTNKRPTFASIHGNSNNTIRATDLSLQHFLGEQLIENSASLAEAERSANTVLLTGANGFLGRFVCLQWMKQLQQNNGKLICLIRAEDNKQARERLEAVFSGLDTELQNTFHSLADTHIEVIAGDASKLKLGLSDDDFDRLSNSVDRISHVAALVNHRLPYQHLMGPNVTGTAEVIRLALSGKRKDIDFVSTEAVQMFLDMQGGNNESAALLNEITLSDRYAAGYAASKWAAEHLLRQASEHAKLSVNIFRGDMMLAHQDFIGQINNSDMFTRILYSVALTGLAPFSFYQLDTQGERQTAHYDGTPVNVVASAVCGAPHQGSGEVINFNISNFHSGDNCSLDTFVDWLESAGIEISRIDDHQTWLLRMQDKLNTLPEDQRKQSALEILSAFAKPLPVTAHSVGCSNYRELMQSIKVEVPHIDQPFIEKCLADMRAIKML